MSALFEDIRVCVFDAYGTVFDVHSAVARYAPRIGAHAEQLSRLWRTKQLEYTWLRTLMGRHTDFWNVTKDALEYALETYGIQDRQLGADLLAAYERLQSYPDVGPVLARLRSGNMDCVLLSNGSPRMLREAIQSTGLEASFTAVLSVEEVSAYKPVPKVYQLVLDHTGARAGNVCFLSSNAWDIAGAASFGFRTAWINRFEQKRERLPFGADAELRDLSGVPALLGLSEP